MLWFQGRSPRGLHAGRLGATISEAGRDGAATTKKHGFFSVTKVIDKSPT